MIFMSAVFSVVGFIYSLDCFIYLLTAHQWSVLMVNKIYNITCTCSQLLQVTLLQ